MPKRVDHQQRRAAIALVAAGTIAETGLEGTTIREIARRSGYSKGIVEHYFSGKEDIIAAALEQMNARYLAREAEQTNGRQGLEALRARLSCVLPLDSETRQEWKIRLCFWSVAAIDPAVRKEQRQRLKLTRERFQTDLEQAAARGEIDMTDHAAMKLSLFVAGTSSCALLDPYYYSKRVLLELIDDKLRQLVSGVQL